MKEWYDVREYNRLLFYLNLESIYNYIDTHKIFKI